MPNILYIKISQEGQEICLSERKEKELPRETGTCCSEGKLTQQKKLLAFVRDHENFAVHLPMLQIMIGTGFRCGELIGLTWKGVGMKKRTVSVDYQPTYKNYGDGCNFHKTLPKIQAGVRMFPMSKMVGKAFETQRRLNFQLGIPRDVEIDGLSDFIFMSRSGCPMMPSVVNFILRDIVKTYNEEERERAKREKREPKDMPHISAHILRHTACTRMAETDLDIKVVQYVMGHANISVTMDVYNHVTDQERSSGRLPNWMRFRSCKGVCHALREQARSVATGVV